MSKEICYLMFGTLHGETVEVPEGLSVYLTRGVWVFPDGPASLGRLVNGDRLNIYRRMQYRFRDVLLNNIFVVEGGESDALKILAVAVNVDEMYVRRSILPPAIEDYVCAEAQKAREGERMRREPIFLNIDTSTGSLHRPEDPDEYLRDLEERYIRERQRVAIQRMAQNFSVASGVLRQGPGGMNDFFREMAIPWGNDQAVPERYSNLNPPPGHDPLDKPKRALPCSPAMAMQDSFDGPEGDAKAEAYLKKKAAYAIRVSMVCQGKRSREEIEGLIEKLGYEEKPKEVRQIPVDWR